MVQPARESSILKRMAFWRPSRDLPWILGLAFALRFFHSDAPLLGTNSWRQCDNATVARNYAERGYRFLRPEVSWGGTGGVVQMEFPAYQYAVALLYRVAGERDWLGRWVSIICSLVSILFFHELVARAAGARVASWAAFFFAIAPLNIYYGRAFMVESPMFLSLIIGVWAFDRWLDRWRDRYFWVASLAIAMGCLLKIVSLYIGLPLVWLAWRRCGARVFRRPALWAMAALVVIPVIAWYSWSGILLAESGRSLMGDWRYGTDKWGDWRLAASLGFWNRILFERVAGKHLTWAGFVIFAWGFLLRRRRHEALFDAWLVAVLVATVIVSRGCWVHEHYQLMFVPPAAVMMGRAFARNYRQKVWRSLRAMTAAFLLVGLSVLAGWRYLQVSSLEAPEDSITWRLAVMIREHTEPGALVVCADAGDPTALYHARRRGWNVTVDDLAAGGNMFLKKLAGGGAEYLAARHDGFMNPDRTVLVRSLVQDHKVVAEDGATFIVRLGR